MSMATEIRGFSKNGPRWPYKPSFNPRSPWAQEMFAAQAAAFLARAAMERGDETTFQKYVEEIRIHEAEYDRLWVAQLEWDSSLECELSYCWDSLFQQTDSRLYRGSYQIEGGSLNVSCSLMIGGESRPYNDDPWPGEVT